MTYGITNRINLKFCRDRKTLTLTFLLSENLKRHYFSKSVSIILYSKSMWQFSFISWNYKYRFFSIFSHRWLKHSKSNIIKVFLFWFQSLLLSRQWQFGIQWLCNLLSVPHLIILVLVILREVSKIQQL